MDQIGTIASIVAALCGIIGIWNSKPAILKRIDRKKNRLNNLYGQEFRMYGLMGRGIGPITSMDRRKELLENQIKNLERKL